MHNYGRKDETYTNACKNLAGIPYAEAKERFVPAERVTPWEGVRLAFNYGPISPQVWLGEVADRKSVV